LYLVVDVRVRIKWEYMAGMATSWLRRLYILAKIPRHRLEKIIINTKH